MSLIAKTRLRLVGFSSLAAAALVVAAGLTFSGGSAAHAAATSRPHHLTAAQLAALQVRVNADIGWFARHKIKLVANGPGIKTDWKENLGIENLTSIQRAEIDQKYGARNLHVYRIPKYDLPSVADPGARPTHLTRAQLLALRNRVNADHGWFARHHIDMVSNRPGINGNWKLNLGVQDLTYAQLCEIFKKFRSRNLHLYGIRHKRR